MFIFKNIREHLADRYSASYAIFMHRQELAQFDKSRMIELAQSKLQLTEVMLAHALCDYYQLTSQEIADMKSQLAYTRKLRERIDALKKLRAMDQVGMSVVPKRRVTKERRKPYS